MRFKKWISLLILTALASSAWASITLYEHDGFHGRSVTLHGPIANLKSIGFNDLASSVIVSGGSWLVCADDFYRGQCVVLASGSYGSMREYGLNDAITSLRPYRRGYDTTYPYPQPVPPADYYPYYQRPGERLFQAPVVAVRAVVDRGGERCWIERHEADRDSAGAAVAGAIIGGILGHQIGGGSGRDAATALGAIAGAAIASNSGGGLPYSRDVRRCEANWSGNVAYWDVTYSFRGRDYHTQMTYRPGSTITVNAYGEPRQ